MILTILNGIEATEPNEVYSLKRHIFSLQRYDFGITDVISKIMEKVTSPFRSTSSIVTGLSESIEIHFFNPFECYPRSALKKSLIHERNMETKLFPASMKITSASSMSRILRVTSYLRAEKKIISRDAPT